MKHKILYLLLVILFASCSGSINGNWKGYEIGGGMPPANWYLDISGERINAIQSLATGDKESYKGTIKLKSSENGINTYDVFFDFGGGIGVNYVLKYATSEDKQFGLYDNSSNDKFQVIMQSDVEVGSDRFIYLEK